MLQSAPVIAFVPTTKPAEAKAFYEGVLGLSCVGEDPYAVVFDAGGTTLRIATVETLTPAVHTILGWTVGDIRAAVAALIAKGVEFKKYAFMEQDGLGIWEAPGGAKIAWFADPDGNTLSLTQIRSD